MRSPSASHHSSHSPAWITFFFFFSFAHSRSRSGSKKPQSVPSCVRRPPTRGSSSDMAGSCTHHRPLNVTGQTQAGQAYQAKGKPTDITSAHLGTVPQIQPPSVAPNENHKHAVKPHGLGLG
uniref:Putative secreted peptide n=1 Tax=Anopheles braziliensis TaxID=58242 RepID=A0A2M3ZNL7_9DIPT